MIASRYIQRNIHLGTLGALLVLVSLSLFFVFVAELDDIGDGAYGLPQVFEYMLFSIPGRIVEFLPLAVLLGSILSLGALAGNSEIIAMQASGVSLGRLLAAVLQAVMLLAVIGFVLGEWVVPDSETAARNMKNLAERRNSRVLQAGKGLWIKDENRVVHIRALLPNGFARGIEIYRLDDGGGLRSTLFAERAVPVGDGLELQQVRESVLAPEVATRSYETHIYEGALSRELLQVLINNPRQMSSMDLLAYINFLEENRLDSRPERLVFWKKIFIPIGVVIMGMLALPFVLGSQRQSSGGQRLMIGILLGLGFVVADRLLTQLGAQLEIDSLLVAALPNLLFLALAAYLLLKKQSHAVGLAFFRRARQG